MYGRRGTDCDRHIIERVSRLVVQRRLVVYSSAVSKERENSSVIRSRSLNELLAGPYVLINRDYD